MTGIASTSGSAGAQRAQPIMPPPFQPRPRRLTRPRIKGVRTPEGAIYVGRPTRWGNPFCGARFGHAQGVKLHREWVDGRLSERRLTRLGFCDAEIDALRRWRIWLLTNLYRLAGHDLQCWCPLKSRWCHADTLLQLAPAYADYERHAL